MYFDKQNELSTLVPRICSIKRVPHTGFHFWVPGKSSKVRVPGLVYGNRKSLPYPGSQEKSLR